MKSNTLIGVVSLGIYLLVPSISSAAIIRLGPGGFTPLAPVITFSEPGYPTGTVNPVYTLAAGSLGTVTVSFDSNFLGQTVTTGSVRTLSNVMPSGPLTLDPTNVNNAFITADGAVPSSPVLSGTPQFNGPIAVLFSQDVAAVGLQGGFFDAINATSITAFNRTGGILGTVTNTQIGNEFFGLADASGGSVISGISFYITGNEPAGFGIDNLTFGARDVITNPGIPEPTSLAIFAVGTTFFVTGGSVRRRRWRCA